MLGPLLFIIYINDIINYSDIFKFTIYADDTTLIATLNPSSEMEMQYQISDRELKKIQQWLNVNKLSLNVEKTKFMIFGMPQKKIDIHRLKLAGTEIESVEHFKFIGITVDKHLKTGVPTPIG